MDMSDTVPYCVCPAFLLAICMSPVSVPEIDLTVEIRREEQVVDPAGCGHVQVFSIFLTRPS